MNSRDYYYLPISSWNLNALFSTESISPHVFYAKRQFGTARNILTTDQEKSLQFENCLILYPQLFHFTPQKGYPIFIAIRRDYVPIDDEYIIQSNGLVYCYKTIYLRRDSFLICIPSEEIKQRILADAAPSIEVKTISKYLTFKKKSSFFIINQDLQLLKSFQLPEIYFFDESLLKKSSESQPFFDKAFNHIKGFVYGLVGGTLGGKDDAQVQLEKSLQNLQNQITAVKGETGLADKFEKNIFDNFIKELEKSKKLYAKVNKETEENEYSIIQLYINELIEYNIKRFTELESQNQGILGLTSDESSHLVQQKESLEQSRINLRDQVQSNYEKIEEFNQRRKLLGRGNLHKELREEIKEDIKVLKVQILDLKTEIKNYSAQINSIQYQLYKGKTKGKTDFDGNIEDIYFKVTSLLSDIMFRTNEEFTNRRRRAKDIKLSKNLFDLKKLTYFWLNNRAKKFDNYILELDDYLFESPILFRVIINTIFEDCRCSNEIPEYQIDEILQTVILKLYREENQEASIRELERLVAYRSTKSFEYLLPDENDTLRNFIAFIFKPSSLEDLERFLFAKNIRNHYLAYCIWTTFNGFASIPKTFTDPIFESDRNERVLDEIDNHLFNCYIQKS